MIKFYTLTALLMLMGAGCGSAPDSKDLFSVWARQNPPGMILDFSGMHIGSNTLRVTVSSPFSAVCVCTIAISGTQDSGQYVIGGCSKESGTGTESDCDSLESSGTFSKTTDTLHVCNASAVCTDWM